MLRAHGSLILLAALSMTTALWAEDSSVTAEISTNGQEPRDGEKASAPAQTPAAQTPAALAPTASSPSAEKSKPIPRDPAGIKGISPYYEAINKGDASYLAQDLDAAKQHYSTAITLEPKNPVAHLRAAEVGIKSQDLTSADEFVQQAQLFSKEDLRYKAQSGLLLAGLRENQGALDEAISGWEAYQALEIEVPKDAKIPARGPLPPRVYAETAVARIAAINRRKEIVEQYAQVRKRMEAAVTSADEQTGEEASKK